MKTKIVLFLILLVALQTYAENSKEVLTSDVTDVKVFLSGAQVNRTFKTTVDEGVTTLAVTELSSQIDANSITATSGGEAMILSTSFSLDYLKEPRMTPQLKSLKDSLEKLTDNLNELNMLKSVYNEEVAMLNANKAVGGSNVGVNFENLQKVIDFYRNRMIDVKGKITDIDKKTAKLNDKIRRINEQIDQENGKLNRPFGTILITVSAKVRSTVNFELSYFARGASWRPSYDIRSKNVSSTVNLLYKANVNQNTGEDWKNVHVSLSTGNPTLGGTKPTLRPWYLRIVEPVQTIYQLEGKAKSRKDAAPMMEQSVVTGGVPASFDDMVVMEENQLVTEFDIQLPYTVLSNGKDVMMDIQSHNLPASYAYYTTPKMDKDAFLIANITGWEKLSLLPGNANVYLENSYVGESYVNPSVTTDTLQLSFGRDKRIIVKREKVKDMNSTKFIGGNVEKDFLFETTIRNTKKDNVTITIEDQIPLSTDENIKITKGELSGGNLNAETGMINWKIELKPGETKSIRLGYKVKYPKDKQIPGL